MTEIVGTEQLVDKILEMIAANDINTGDWPLDAEPRNEILTNLSWSKMVNEINEREPRMITENGLV